MPVTLNASTSSGLIATSDTSGDVAIQSNGTTKLTVSSTGVNIGQYNPGTSLITSGTAVASTSGTSIDFTSIPSWVKRITVMFDGVSTNGTSSILIQVGDSGGVETSGYVSRAERAGESAASTAGFIINSSSNATATYQGAIVLANLNAATFTWVANGNLNSTVQNNVMTSAGSKSLSATLDRVRITTVNGTDTFDAGTINILYE